MMSICKIFTMRIMLILLAHLWTVMSYSSNLLNNTINNSEHVSRHLTVTSFAYSSGYQQWSVPSGVSSATFSVSGAGYDSTSDTTGCVSGLGATASITISVSPGTIYYIYLGGVGSIPNGGTNGGGDAASGAGVGGYGGSDVRTTIGDLNSRIVVAGGGGGCYTACSGVGSGGNAGTNGYVGTLGCSLGTPGGGASQSGGGSSGGSGSTVGSLGQGGVGATTGNLFGGGGGGGYYGGGGAYYSGGGGGSSYAPGGTITDGDSGGPGSCTITWVYTPTRLPTQKPTTILPTVKPSVKPTVIPTVKPTIKPTIVPTVIPTQKPTSMPTSIPTQPSGQPSSTPSAHPTNQPTATPTRSPSRQPSARPSVSPTRQPSSRPTRQPSSQPTRQPTRQPTGQPTGQPSTSPTRQPSCQPTSQPTQQPFMVPTSSPTCQPSSTPTRQPSVQPTTQPSGQPTRQPTSRPSRQPTGQPSRQPSTQPSSSPTRQPSSQPSRTPSQQPSSVPTQQPTVQPSSQPTVQPTVQPSRTPSQQPSSRPTQQPTIQPTGQPSRQPSSQPTRQPSSQPSMQPSRRPTTQPSAKPSQQPSASPSLQPSSHPSVQPTCQPSEQPSQQPSAQPSAVPTEQPSSQPSRTPSGQPSSQPSRQPTQQPSSRPSVQPTCQPSRQPTSQPSSQPTTQPTMRPSSQPSTQPSSQPSIQPTMQPSSRPSTQPTMQPSGQPSSRPSTQPTSQPTNQPSGTPSRQPSSQPSCQPSSQPSRQPSAQPSSQPTRQPSSQPSIQPSTVPTMQPTCRPSMQPSSQPTGQPTRQPSVQPSNQPSSSPTTQPSSQPSIQPTNQPTSQPSLQPTSRPTNQPSAQPSTQPTSRPTEQPTRQPSSQPTSRPSMQPSAQPSRQPTGKPSCQPTSQPSVQPTSQPSRQPTSQPSNQPTCQPTMQPSRVPTTQPSDQPTRQPSSRPTTQPSSQPSDQPSVQPSNQPTGQPSCQPSQQPTRAPTSQPSCQPTSQPSSRPSTQPSSQPSRQPSIQPSSRPTSQPSMQPSSQPSSQPTTQPSSQPSRRPSCQPTSQPSTQPTAQPSSQPTTQPSCQPTIQPTGQPTVQPSEQPSARPSNQPSCQPSSQPSAQPSAHPSNQPTSQPSARPSSQPSVQPSGQPTEQPSSQPSSGPTTQPSRQPSVQPSSQPSAKPTCQPSSQPSSQPSRRPTEQPTSQPSQQPSSQPSRRPTSQPSTQPSSQPSSRPTVQPSSQPSSKPSCQPSEQPSSQPSSQPSRRPTSQPSLQPSCQPTTQPSSRPSCQPSSQPTMQPTRQPSSRPSQQPTSQPTGQPSVKPSSQPSSQPSDQPSSQPTSQPSRQPTTVPTMQPTSQPSIQPSSQPTSQPSRHPSCQPSVQPSSQPTRQPSSQPSVQPTHQPSSMPSLQPSGKPTNQPSSRPTSQPSQQPTGKPTTQPSSHPSMQPSSQPSGQPSSKPSNQPTSQPSEQPSSKPTQQPSSQPSMQPTTQPTTHPTSQPTIQPSSSPTMQPSASPSTQPTTQPTNQPSEEPSGQPSAVPTGQPSRLPSSQPSAQPSDEPTNQPTMIPSNQPSSNPTSAPSVQPSSRPSVQPSTKPSNQPSRQPTRQPSSMPSAQPSTSPTEQPSSVPSMVPTSQPSGVPSRQPASRPTSLPTCQPSSRPSSQPSEVPSSHPSNQPTSRPSRQPTLYPTVQPTSNPSFNGESRHPTISPTSSVPTSQPTDQPTIDPTSQPTIIPTSSPTKQPSGIPSMQPSSQPSSLPSQQPSRMPTTQPSMQPTDIPSRQPSQSPSSMPSLQPVSVPTGAPSKQPVSVPTSQPSMLPSEQPSSQPSGIPSLQPFSHPSARPTRQPTSQPSRRPSRQPSSQPSRQPASRPSCRPTHQPSGQPSRRPTQQPVSRPSSQPNMTPSSRPTKQPSGSPTKQPVGRPSSQPSRQPSSRPSRQPTGQPSRRPTSQPTSVPSTSVPTSSAPMMSGMTRTRKPTPRPTTRPTSCPSASPSSQPSISLQSLWILKMQQMLEKLTAKDVVGGVVSRSTYYDLQVDNSQIFGGCDKWKAFQLGDMSANNIFLKVSSIQFTFFDSVVDDSRDSVNSTVSCWDPRNASTVVHYLTGDMTGNVSQVCNDHVWKLRSCGANVAVCVDCEDPCLASSQCDAEGNSIYSYALSPSVETTCSGSVSVGKVLSVAFKEWSSAPDIIDMSIVPEVASVTVNAVLSGDGSLYCGYFLSSSKTTIASANLILIQNFGSHIVNNQSSVILTGMLPLTQYDVYCISYNTMGASLSIPKVIQYSQTITTVCCNVLSVSLSAVSYTSDVVSLNMLKIVSDGIPSNSVQVSLSASTIVNGSEIIVDAFYPNWFLLDSKTYFVGDTLTSSLVGLPSGVYLLVITVSGFSAAEFSVSYSNGQMFEVKSQNEEPPTPIMLSAIFAKQGTSFAVKFDSPTSKGGLATSFTCSSLLTFKLSSQSQCQWIDSVTVYAFVSGDDAVSVDDVVTLQANKLTASCPSGVDCSTWKTSVSSSVSIQAPSEVITPTVSLVAPATIGSCDSLTLDITGSLGNGGRSWKNVTFSVASSDGDATAIKSFLTQSYKISPPSAIPSNLIHKGVFYYFVVSVCNFFGKCNSGNTRVVVLNSIIPSVSIPGLPLRSIFANFGLSLSSNAIVSQCDGTTSTSGISYSWTVKKDGATDFSLESKSIDSSKFVLAPYSLITNSVYEVTVVATLQSSLKSSSATVQICVNQSSIVAVIAGGSTRTIGSLGSLTLDGSSSYDLDVRGSTGSAAGLIYSWSCYQTSPVLSSNCGLRIESDVISETLSLVPDNSSVNSSSIVTLVLFDSLGHRTSQSSVTVNVVGGYPPLLSLSSNVIGKLNPSNKLLLTGSAKLQSTVSGMVEWSVDDGSVDLSVVGLLPVQSNVNSSGSILMPFQFNSLPAGSTLVFSLTCVLKNGVSSTASITVVTNSPPLAGLFDVNPIIGREATDLFTLSASQWQDVDIPLTYLFSMASLSTSQLTLQSRSELAYGYKYLPAGLVCNNYSLTCFVQVFDSYSANSSKSTHVQVEPILRNNSTQFFSYLSSVLSGSSNGVDDIKSTSALVSTILNSAQCEDAPDCFTLNRESCSIIENTCGACFSGFMGDSEGNSPCITQDEYKSLIEFEASSEVLLCNVTSDCSSVPWHDCVNGSCVRILQSCSNDCSSQGVCHFVSTLNSSHLLTTCETGSTDCDVICHCSEGYYGVTCSQDQYDYDMRLQLRDSVLNSLTQLVSEEDATAESISDWANIVASAAQSSTELTPAAVSNAQFLVDSIIANALSLQVSTETIITVLDALDSVISHHIVHLTSRRRLESSATNAEDIESSLKQFGALMSSNMVSGEASVGQVKKQFRLSSHALSSETALLSIPLTSSETALGKIASAVRLMSDSSVGTKVSTVMISSSLYGNSEFQSDPLQVHFNSELPCVGADCEVFVEFYLQNHVDYDYSDRTPEPFLDLCLFDHFNVYEHICPNGFVIEAACNGTRQILSNTCPFEQPVTVCNSVAGVSAVASGCTVVQYSSSETTCRCPISGSGSTSRRLQVAVEGNSTLTASTGGSANIVAMASFIGHEFVSTILSAEKLSVTTVRSAWKVLTTLGFLAFTVLLVGGFAHRSDAQERKAKISDDLIKAKSQLLSTNKRTVRVPQFRQNSIRRTFSQFSFESLIKKLGPSTRIVPGVSKEMMDIENSLPSMLRSAPFTQRFIEEVKHFHRWLGVIFYYSPNFPRVLRVISLATNVIAMLFVQSITYNLTNPDDGSCELYHKELECLTPKSDFGSGDTKCVWHPGYRIGHCTFNEPSHSLTIVLFVAVFAALISTPIALTADWVIMNVLSARTKQVKLIKPVNSMQAVVPSSDNNIESSALPFRSHRRVGTVGQAVTTTSHPVTMLTDIRRRFSVAQYLGLQMNTTLTTTLQDDLTALLRGLCGYRETLSETQKVEFNGLWGLAESGHFITNNPDDKSWRARFWLQKSSGGDSVVQEAITNDLKDVRNKLENELESFTKYVKSNKARGQRLLFLFQRDLMPGMNGKILESKGKRDSLQAKEVSAAFKLCAWTFIVLLNGGMLFYIYLFALQQTEVRQAAWFKSFLIWLVMEIFFVSTAIVYVTHFLIPSLTMKDVARIKQKLLNTIKDYNDQAREMKKKGLETVEEEPNKVFNAANYLFVSYRLAQQYPDLKESKIISRFSTPWPTQSYHHVRDVSKSYSKKFSSLTRSASIVLIFLVGNLIQVPHSLQDMIISTGTTGMVGYSFLVHIQLYHIYPILVIIPTILLAVIVHFIIKANNSHEKLKLARLSPSKPLSVTRKVLFPGDVGYTAPKFARRRAGSSDLDKDQSSSMEETVGNVNHKTRRASIQQGRQVVKELQQEHQLHQAIDRNDYFQDSDVESDLDEDEKRQPDDYFMESIGESKDDRGPPRSPRRWRSETLGSACSEVSDYRYGRVVPVDEDIPLAAGVEHVEVLQCIEDCVSETDYHQEEKQPSPNAKQNKESVKEVEQVDRKQVIRQVQLSSSSEASDSISSQAHSSSDDSEDIEIEQSMLRRAIQINPFVSNRATSHSMESKENSEKV